MNRLTGLLCVTAAAGWLRADSTGGLRLEPAGSLTSDKSEVIAGTRSIKGVSTGTAFAPFLRTYPETLSFRRNRTYRVTFRYKILQAGPYKVHFDAPSGRPRASDNASFDFTGTPGETGQRTFVATLQGFDDYSLFLAVNGTGAISVDDVVVTDQASGEVVAAEDAEPGTLLLPTSFFVSAAKTSFVWGEAVKVAATLRDEAGQLRNPGPVTWTVSPPGAAAVAADGTVTPAAPQTFTVRGTASGRSGEVKLQARPKRIVVIPETPSMTVGARQRMRADVLDVNDKPIPNARVEWAVDSNSATAGIDQSGMLEGRLEARIRAIARIRYPDAIPGFISQSQGDAVVEIKAAGTYRFERIWVARPGGTASSTLAPRPSQLVPTEGGGFLFAASLDGLGGALLEWSNGQVKPVLTSGRLHIQSGLPLTEIAAYARNSSGEILARELDAASNGLVSGGRAGQMTPVFTNGTAVFGTDRVSGFNLGRNSLSDSGTIAANVSFTDSASGRSGQGIFRGYGRRLYEPALTTIDERLNPADLPTNYNFHGIADDGTVWAVSCCNGPVQGLWRSRPGALPEKLIWRGGPLGDAIVAGTSENFTGAPTLFVAPNGDVISAASTNRGSRWLLWHRGDTTPSEILSASTTASVFWYDPAVGALLDTSFPGAGRGLYLWSKGATRPVLLLNDASLDGSPVEEIVSAACTSRGIIFAMVRTANSPMLIARVAPDKEVLLKAGDTVPFEVPPVISALIPGARTGTPLVLAGGQTGSIGRLDDNGGVTPIVKLGDRLPGRQFYVGSRANQVRVLPDGRIVFGQDRFAPDSGIYAWNKGTIQPAVSTPLTHATGQSSSYVSSVEVNRGGDILLWTGYGSSSLFRIRGSELVRVASGSFTVDGVELTPSTAGSAIDEAGRILYSAASNGVGPYLGLWDGADSHIVQSPDSKAPDGRVIGLLGSLRGCGGGFIGGAFGTLLLFRNNSWQYLTDSAEPLATGAAANTLNANSMDVNYACGVAFLAGGIGPGTWHIGARLDSKYHELQNLNELTPEGDLLRVIQLLINDDGTVFVLGANDRGQQVLYRGSPLP